MGSTSLAGRPALKQGRRFSWRVLDVRQGKAMGYFFIVPSLIMVTVFVIYPVIQSFYWSFTNWTGFGEAKWVGLDNYIFIFRNHEPLEWLWHNVVFATLYTSTVIVVGLTLALILNQPLIARNTFRTIYFIPYVIPGMISALVWNFMLTPQFDPLDALFRAIGLGQFWQPWLGNAYTAFYVAIFITVWSNIGFSMVLYLAGLQNIPQDLYDAANVDGANRVQRIIRITIPLLRPITLVILILSIIGSMKIFEVIWGLTHGIQRPPMEVIGTAIYRVGFGFNKVGQASALSVVLFAIIFVLTIIQLQLTRSGEAIEY